MEFDLTDEQKEIKAVARELLAARSPWGKVREAAGSGAYDRALWEEMVALGWPGIAVPEADGGQGLGMLELAVVLEELGYACAATPLLPTATAAAVIAAAGSDEQRDRWLPGLCAGDLRGGVGRRELVADGAAADVVVLVDDDFVGLVAGGRAEPFAAIDPTRRYASLSGEAQGERLEAGAGDRVLVAIAAEMVGLCQRALEMSVEYAKERRQFGVPIGSFQAVSHRCAEMLLATESARAATYFAAWAADSDPAAVTAAAAMAAATAADGGREVAGSALQVHGAIGFTWEADVHWLYKRAALDAALLGGATRHRIALARDAATRIAARPAR